MKFNHFKEWFDYHIRLSGLSQKQFAIEINASENSISFWCIGRGKPNLENFYKACRIFAKYQQRNIEEFLIEADSLL